MQGECLEVKMNQIEWISVEDKKPKPGIIVLMTSKYTILMGYYLDGKWKNDTGNFEYPFITHWMPLPELPKTKQRIDITRIQKLIHDYHAASRTPPEELLIPPDIYKRLEDYAFECNTPLFGLFMGVPIRVSFAVPPGTIYIGKIQEK
jgi:hypothetical protein